MDTKSTPEYQQKKSDANLYGRHRDLLEHAREAKEAAGRSEAGRLMAVYVTELEKGLAWIESVARHHGFEEEMIFGAVGALGSPGGTEE